MSHDQPRSSAFPVRMAGLVVGVDGSPESLYALDLAATLGASTRATITIVHVRPRPLGFAFGSAGSVEYDRAEDALEAEVGRVAGDRLATYPGAWSVVGRRGHVAHELLAVADAVDADLVVVGHHSQGAVRDAILGSVATGTVHDSRRNVLIAIAPAPREPGR